MIKVLNGNQAAAYGVMLARNKRSMERGFHEVKATQLAPAAPGRKAAAKPPSAGPRPIPFESKFESPWADVQKMLTVLTGDWRFQVPLLDKGTCRQCGWCQLSCPLGCLKEGADGYFHPDLVYCKGCGICAHECPAYAIRMVPEEVA